MKLFYLSCCSLVLALFLNPSSVSAAETTASVLATSPSGPVTAADLTAYLKQGGFESPYYEAEVSDYVSTNGLSQAIRDILLERKLAEIAISRKLDETSQTRHQLHAARRKIVLQAAQEHLFEKNKVSEAELLDYYRKNQSQFTHPEHVELTLFMLPKQGTGEFQEKRMKALRSALETKETGGGASGFEDVNSGAVVVKRGEFPPAVEKMIFSSGPGELTPVFERPKAWYLAKIVQHRTTATMSFDNVRPYLEQQLNQKAVESEQKAIENRLSEEMPLVIDEEALARVLSEGITTSNLVTVVARVAETSMTLIDILPDVDVRRQLTKELLRGWIEDHAREFRIMSWAKQTGIALRDSTWDRFMHEKNRILSFAHLVSIDHRTTATDQELRQLYDKDPEKFHVPMMWDVTQLSLPFPKWDERSSMTLVAHQNRHRELLAFMNRVRDQITTGTKPEEVLARYGSSGESVKVTHFDFGPAGPRGQLLDRTVENMKPGEISPVVESDKGLFLFIVHGVKQIEPRTFEEAKHDVFKEWQIQQRFEEDRLLIERLYKETAPVIDEKALRQFRETSEVIGPYLR